MDQRQLLEEYDRYQAEAKALIAARRDPVRARFCLTKAAELIHRAATNTSDPALAAVRRQQAERLLDLGRQISARGAAWGAPSPNEQSADSGAAVAGAGSSAHGFTCLPRPELRFADIAGLDALKNTLRRRVLDPLQHPELAARYGIRPGVGLLLHGPPGTGKTMLAQAIAGEVGAPFYVIKPSDILVRYVGDSEQRLQALFAEARAHPLSVIFIDEIDALAPSRERGADSSGVMARLVPQILQELDGAGSRGTNPILLVGATNEPWSLDPALLRPGRFDLRVLVDLPDRPALAELLRIHLRGLPQAGIDPEAEAGRYDGWSGADIKALIDAARIIPFTEAVNGAAERPLGPADLAIAASRLAPSVAPARRDRHRHWQDGPSAAPQPPASSPAAAPAPALTHQSAPCPPPVSPQDTPVHAEPADDPPAPTTLLSPFCPPPSGPFAEMAPIRHPAVQQLLAELARPAVDDIPAPRPGRAEVCDALRQQGLDLPADDEIEMHAGAATLRFAIPGARAPGAAAVEALAERLLTAHRLRLVSARPAPGRLVISVAREPRAVPIWPWLALQDPTRPCERPLIGPDEDGGPAVCLDLAGGDPHCLIAGSTGGGKSVLLRSLILDLALRGDLRQIRLLLIDPKRLDLAPFARLPHLARPPITDPDEALAAIAALVDEMERRYRLLATAGVTNLADYQQRGQGEALPRIVACCDEFADWMLDEHFKAEASAAIARLGAKARAAGIHLILATQRPEARVVPPLLRANLSGRICLRVATARESDLVIDRPGGERLLGQGHALSLLNGQVRPVQVPWLSPADLGRLLDCLVSIPDAEVSP